MTHSLPTSGGSRAMCTILEGISVGQESRIRTCRARDASLAKWCSRSAPPSLGARFHAIGEPRPERRSTTSVVGDLVHAAEWDCGRIEGKFRLAHVRLVEEPCGLGAVLAGGERTILLPLRSARVSTGKLLRAA